MTAGLILILYGSRPSIEFSNRIAGQLYRIIKEVSKRVNGVDVIPFHLSKDDFLLDVADNFNDLAGKHKELKARYESLLLESSQENGILDTIKEMSVAEETITDPGTATSTTPIEIKPDMQLDESTK